MKKDKNYSLEKVAVKMLICGKKPSNKKEAQLKKEMDEIIKKGRIVEIPMDF